jgi:E1-E2 ATPase
VSGSAYYLAEKVGAQRLAHRLTEDARAFRRIYTPLQRQINVIIQLMLLVALSLEILLVLAVQDNRLSLVTGVKMAVVILGTVPKGLLLATSVAYALGAVRIVGKGVLVQQANAIEALSNVDVLCLDKTGTLTANAAGTGIAGRLCNTTGHPAPARVPRADGPGWSQLPLDRAGGPGLGSDLAFHLARSPLRALPATGLEGKKMLTYSNHVGLYAEEMGPTGEALGNFPQAFTHLSLITACSHVDQALNARKGA